MVQLVKLPQLLAAEDWPAAEKLLRRAAGAKGAGAQVFYNLAKVIEMRGTGITCATGVPAGSCGLGRIGPSRG